MVPPLSLGSVPGLVPGHVPGLSADLRPPELPPTVPAAATVAADVAPQSISPAAPGPAPVATVTAPAEAPIAKVTPTETVAPVQSADAILAEQVIQAARQSLGKAGKDDRGALAAYYATAAQPVWIDGKGLTSRGTALLAEFKRADDWGLRAADFVVATAASVKSGSKPAELADAETKLGLAALKYARHARGGRVEPLQISDNLDRKAQLLEPRAVVAGLMAATAPDQYLRRLHPQHPQFELLRQAYITMRDNPSANTQPIAPPAAAATPSDTKGGKKKAAEAPAAPVKGSAKKLLANLEMWRWMPTDLGATHVFVNVPEFQFRLVRDGAIVHSERVITGKTITQTPIFSESMQTVVFKPRWNVPDSIKVKELLPALFKSPDALAKQDLKVELNGQDIDPRKVNWSTTDIRAFHVYQPSGPSNALGVVKFLFPNKHAVYLHDTPTKALFNSPSRAYSHGCIRIRNPVRFAEVLMEQDKKWTPAQVKTLLDVAAEENNHVNLTKKFPVHIAYFTATAAADGTVTYLKDIYDYEGNINLGIDGKANQIVKPPKDEDTPIRAVKLDDPRVSRSEQAVAKSTSPDWAKSLFGMN
jgi:L,D-transpeptidase YcbB